MKKNILVILAFFLALFIWTNAEYKVYDNQEDFENAKWWVCLQATDWCNSFWLENWKISYGTEMWCENHKVEWNCTEYKKDVMTTRAFPATTSITTDMVACTMEYAPVCWVDWKTYSNKCVASAQNKVEVDYEWQCKEVSKPLYVVYWKIIKIENWKDGQQIYIKTNNWNEYNTAVSFWDTILNENIGLYLWNRIKIYYTDQVAAMNLLIWNKVEIVSRWLSENDMNLNKVLKKDLDHKFQSKVNTILYKYLNLVDWYTNEKKQAINNRVVDKLENKISSMLMKYPQDIALPREVNAIYLTYELLNQELRKLDFIGYDYIGWNKAVELAKDWNIKWLFQTHNLDVQIETLDWKTYFTKEEKIDDFMKLKQECWEKCSDLPIATE